MPAILPLLLALTPVSSKKTLRHLHRIVEAMLAMTGRITQLGLSRWTDKGGSYRSIQRFFHTKIDWCALQWLFFERYFLNEEAVYLLAGDETPISKAGKHTHGVDQFFSSTLQKVIPAVACFSFALIDVHRRQAYSLSTRQIVRTPEDKEYARQEKRKQKLPSGRKPGRPPGSKNKNKAEVTFSPEMQRIKEQGEKLLARIGNKLRLTYLVLDGYYGHSVACGMVRQMGLHLISKMPHNTKLYLLPTKEQKARHSRVKYGDRLHVACLPEAMRFSSVTEGDYRTEGYHAHCLHELFADPIHVVILVRTHLPSGRRGHVIFFSSDLTLAPEKILEYYGLRFQIEFTFRDAKQYFGLEDFMAVKETSVTNAIGLSFFMVNLATYLLSSLRAFYPEAGVTDLKSFYRAQHYVSEVLKCLPENPGALFGQALVQQICQRSLIHGRQKKPQDLDLAA